MKVNCSRWWRVFSTCQAHAVCHLPFTIWQDLSAFKCICFDWNYICSNCKINLFGSDQFKINSFQLNQIAKYICTDANHAFCSLLFMIQLLDAALSKYILKIINHRIINLICSNFACQACLLLFTIHPWAALWTVLWEYICLTSIQISRYICADVRQVLCHLPFTIQLNVGRIRGLFNWHWCKRGLSHCNRTAGPLQVQCSNSGSAQQFRQHKAVELHRSAAGCLIQVLNMCNTRKSSVWQGMTASRSLESAQMQGEVEQSSAGPGLQL